MTKRVLLAPVVGSLCLWFTACSKSECLTGSTKCGTTCVNLQQDQLNCGACGTSCAGGQVCSAGACALSCQTSLTDCSGSCVNTQTDRANCGACNHACAAGQVCSAGACALSCQANLTDCSGSCVNTQTDRANCGACNHACAAGQVCSAGTCDTTCAARYTTCGAGPTAYCADTLIDPANCGACGRACPPGTGCSAGACVSFSNGHRVFTACGATGPTGPSQAVCDAAYAATPLEGEVAVAGGIQTWTVPMTGRYRIEAAGAQGASATTVFAGGQGARVRGDFALAVGAKLRVLVGQQGMALGKASGSGNGGGGGGTFVVDSTTGKPLVVAGGGGGTRQAASQNGCDGRASQEGGGGSFDSPTSSCLPRGAGTAGTGGSVSQSGRGSGGGGFTTDGASDVYWGQGGFSLAAGGNGGTPPAGCGPDGPGGFGGGGTGNGCYGGGGGGGYSGGDGGSIAGGGGSFNGGVDPVSVAGANAGDGLVTIDLLGDDPCVPAPGSLSQSIAGPARLYNFCWYLGTTGTTCDAVCAELLGTNLAVVASTSFPDSCGAPAAGDVSTWFRNNANACGWTTGGGTAGKTLGYGYLGSSYFGKCAAGTSMGIGAFPGDTNDSATRCVVCPCFSTY